MSVSGSIRRRSPLVFALVALVAIGLSLAMFDAQLGALTVGGRDLGFFMATYEHLLDVPVWGGLAVQPNGNDAFGFTGLDGHPTLHHDIHLSPLKYLLAAGFVASRSWLVVQLALVSTLLAALSYFVHRCERATGEVALPLAATLALAVSPPFVSASCHDLRPAIALGAFTLALAAALLSRAPMRHVWILAVLGLLVREDASVSLALASAWLLLDGRRSDALRLHGLVLIYVVSFHALHFALLPFAYRPYWQTYGVWATLLSTPLLALAPPRAAEALLRLAGRHRRWTILALAVPFLVVLLAPLHGGHLVRSAGARAFPALMLVWLVATYGLAGSARWRRIATTSALVLSVPLLLLSVRSIVLLRATAAREAPVWTLAARLSPETPVLTDFAHYQAFAGRDHLLVWSRLPAVIEPTEAREFPRSRAQLARLLTDYDGLVVVSEASFETLEQIRSDGAGARFERCSGPWPAVVARLETSPSACPAR